MDSWGDEINALFSSSYTFNFSLINLIVLAPDFLYTWRDVVYAGMVFIFGIKNEIFNYLPLEHYFDILRATLPEFIDTNRPFSLGIVVRAISNTGGGIALPATFIEGGFLQMIFVGLLYGYFLCSITYRIKSAFTIVLCGVVWSTSMRVMLYGEQSLYKYSIAFVFLYFLFDVTGLFKSTTISKALIK